MTKTYTKDQEFVLFTNINNSSDIKTGCINYNLLSNTITKDILANNICPTGYSYSFITGDVLQTMINNGQIT